MSDVKPSEVIRMAVWALFAASAQANPGDGHGQPIASESATTADFLLTQFDTRFKQVMDKIDTESEAE